MSNRKIELNEKVEIKIEKIQSQFHKEIGEELTQEDCLRISVEALYEEVDNHGIGRMFLRKYLWEKGVVYLSGKDGIIGSQ